jgi:hypothetical protein
MSKKTITLIAVLGAVLLLGVGYYWSLNRKTTGNAYSYEPYTPPVTLGNLLASDIVKIEAPGITLEKNDEVWELAYYEGEIPPGGIALDQQRIMSMTYSLANVWTERLVDEEPEDISVYGLDEPSSRLVVTDSSGQKVEYFLGNLTPSMMSYYIMQEGDPAVYSVASYVGGYMQLDLDDLRQRYIIPYIQPEELELFVIDSPAHRIEISRRSESVPLHLASSYSMYFINSPYQLPRGTHSENLSSLLNDLTYLSVMDFVDDNPGSLSPYGLDNAVRVFFQGESESLDLLLGNEVDGLRYAKFPHSSGIFTVYGAESIVNANPFSLVDKFALLVNIQAVDSFTVSGGGRTLYAEANDREEEPVFTLNGKRAEERSFRQFYQAVIGLLMDAEYHADPGFTWDLSSDENITIEYRLYTPPGERMSITLLPYNRDFYVLRQEGTMEFLIARNQVRRIFEAADALVYQE